MKIRVIAHLKAPDGQFDTESELEQWVWNRIEKAAVSSSTLNAFFKDLDLEVLVMSGNLGVTKQEGEPLFQSSEQNDPTNWDAVLTQVDQTAKPGT